MRWCICSEVTIFDVVFAEKVALKLASDEVFLKKLVTEWAINEEHAGVKGVRLELVTSLQQELL